jgi:60 kDa SS-A/Ro ribonucleoprotein
MTKHLVATIQRETTPSQLEPYREDQVENSAGGYSWGVDEWTHLRRFLILGSKGGSYYASEKDLTKQGFDTIEKCLSINGRRLVDTIVEVSVQGLAPKNDYAIFALAVVVAKGSDDAKAYALRKLNDVARIGTHLFQFCEFLNQFGSLTGRAKRRALAKWYTDKDASTVAYQTVKYRQRNGWTHKDVLRLSHPGSKVSSGNPAVVVSNSHKEIFNWIVNGWEDNDFSHDPNLDKIRGFELIQRAKTANRVAEHIRKYDLPREVVPTEFLTNPEVWQALLDVKMPMTALIRNLANMTRVGLLTSTSDATQDVIKSLLNEEYLQKARIHPINILFALKTYASGAGFRGTNTWTPVQTIVDALDSAFYKSFKFVEPTNKRILLALDVSGSMSSGFYGGSIAGTNISPREASGAMALVTAATEKRYEIVGFYDELSSLDISPKMRLDTVLKNISGLPFGGTDCALPMLYAQKNELEFDAFVVYTDSETWAGNIHPAQALNKYRRSSGIEDASLTVVGMVSNGFSIADPNDARMLDVVGFDTSAPQLISNFIAGRI